MPDRKTGCPATIEDDRAAYFAGRITAHEYLRRNLPVPEPQDRGLTEQLRRILDRLTSKSRPNHSP